MEAEAEGAGGVCEVTAADAREFDRERGSASAGAKPPPFLTPVLGGEALARQADAWGGCQLGISSPSIIQQLIKNKVCNLTRFTKLVITSLHKIPFWSCRQPSPPEGGECVLWEARRSRLWGPVQARGAPDQDGWKDADSHGPSLLLGSPEPRDVGRAVRSRRPLSDSTDSRTVFFRGCYNLNRRGSHSVGTDATAPLEPKGFRGTQRGAVRPRTGTDYSQGIHASS